jgi:hypothetical protein
MWDFQVTTTHTARKIYLCDACDQWTQTALTQDEVEPQDWLIAEQARRDKYRILPGMRYVRIVGKWEGEFCTMRMREDMHAVCEKYGVYED